MKFSFLLSCHSSSLSENEWPSECKISGEKTDWLLENYKCKVVNILIVLMYYIRKRSLSFLLYLWYYSITRVSQLHLVCCYMPGKHHNNFLVENLMCLVFFLVKTNTKSLSHKPLVWMNFYLFSLSDLQTIFFSFAVFVVSIFFLEIEGNIKM